MREEHWEDEPQDDGELDFSFSPLDDASARTATIKSSSGALAAIKTLNTTQQLLTTDAFWTNELSRLEPTDELTGQDAELLEEAGVDLRMGLAAIRPLARGLARVFENDLTDEDVEQALTVLEEQPEARPGLELVARWSEALEGAGLREAVIAACNYVDEEAPQESAEIGIKLERIRERSIPAGDLSQTMKCALVLVAAGAAVATAACTLPAAAIAGASAAVMTWMWAGASFAWVAAGSTAVVSWTEMKCTGLLSIIRQRRRRRSA